MKLSRHSSQRKEKVSWLRLVARPLELELEKEMSIEKH
jgi:hypothetical protein